MGGNAAGLADLNEPAFAEQKVAPKWDRFAHWPQARARLALAVLLGMLLVAAWAPGMSPPPPPAPDVQMQAVGPGAGAASAAGAGDSDAKDNDLRLYRLITERVRQSDDYYAAAVELQRANDYPVKPGLTVRPPTLAFATVLLGPIGVALAEIALVAGIILSNFRRFASEPGGMHFRLFAIALLFVGMANGLHYPFLVLHEVWAAELMALSFGLHRPRAAGDPDGRWLGALLAAAAALSIRELALPFVLLMAAYAAWRRNWREAAAWVALIALFVGAMAVHLHLADAQMRPGDPSSPPWLVFGGLQGWLYKVINASSLTLLPTLIAGPLVILAVFGWTGWRSAAGDFAALLVLGYGLAFMIAGRDNNFYWGVIITPILFMGFAMVPFAAGSLWQRATGRAVPWMREQAT
ncbi:MAG: hypothetical protein ABI673_09565 [Novosphingobium sp.]